MKWNGLPCRESGWNSCAGSVGGRGGGGDHGPGILARQAGRLTCHLPAGYLKRLEEKGFPQSRGKGGEKPTVTG